jgi:hypothetical protein
MPTSIKIPTTYSENKKRRRRGNTSALVWINAEGSNNGQQSRMLGSNQFDPTPDFFADEELNILEFPESFGKPKVEKKIFDKKVMRWISMAVNFRLETTLGP